MFKNPWIDFFYRVYNPLLTAGDHLRSALLLYLRITWGHQFFLFGLHKLRGIEETVQFFQDLGIPQATFHAYLVGISECVFGFCLFIGFASRLVSIPLMIIMLVALSTAHAPEISEFRFLLQPLSLVGQPPYPFLLTCLLVFIFGPGKVSVDGWLKRFLSFQEKY